MSRRLATMLQLAVLAACGSRTFEPFDAGTSNDAASDRDGISPEVDASTLQPCHDDLDADGYDSTRCGGRDCDDLDPSVHPEVGDPIVEWQSEVVDATDDPGGTTEIELDGAGKVHIAYTTIAFDYEGVLELRYATNVSGVWTIDVIDHVGRVYYYPIGLALDSAGNPHITYSVEERNELRWAHREDDRWTIEVIASAMIQPGIGSSVEVTPDGTLHVVYGPEGEGLFYARRGDEWRVQNLTPGYLYWGSLGFTSDGSLHVSYMGSGAALRHGRLANDGWHDEVVLSDARDATTDISQVVDESDRIDVAFFSEFLSIASLEEREWTVEVVDAEARGAATLRCIARLAAGTLWIGYSYGSLLRVARRVEAGWSIETVATLASRPSFAADDDSLHFSHGTWNWPGGQLMHTWRALGRECR